MVEFVLFALLSNIIVFFILKSLKLIQKGNAWTLLFYFCYYLWGFFLSFAVNAIHCLTHTLFLSLALYHSPAACWNSCLFILSVVSAFIVFDFHFLLLVLLFFRFLLEWTMITGCTSKSIIIIYVVYFHFQFLLEFSRFFNDLRVHCLTVVVPLFKYNPACFSFSPHYLLLELSVRNLKPRLRFMLGYLISFAIQNVNWRRYSSVSSIENHPIFALIFRFQ